MKRLLPLLLMVTSISLLGLSSCSKGGGGGGTTPEENLNITTSPAINGQLEAPGVGPDFPLTVTVNSAMPPQGVRIEVTARPDGSGTAFFTETKTTSAKTTTFQIKNTPAATPCRVTVTVTSVSKPSNTVSGFYLYSRKS